MAESIIPQSVISERIDEQRARIAQLTGLLALTIQAAQEMESPDACDTEAAEDLEQALQIAHHVLYEVYCGLETTEMVLFKPEEADSTEEVRS